MIEDAWTLDAKKLLAVLLVLLAITLGWRCL